jgi:cyclophilin family peptidyl-prolyl cis-trans isomerase
MKKTLLWLTTSSLFALQLWIPLASGGQDPAATEKNAEATPTATSAETPKNKAFMAKFQEFMEIIKKLRALKLEYQDATPERQTTIQKEYQKLVDQGAKMQKEMLQLGIEAYKEAPNQNDDVTNYLLSSTETEIRMDNYETGFELAKLLIDHGMAEHEDRKAIYRYGGMAAFATMHLDLAEKWLNIANDADLLDQQSKMFLANIPKYREYWKEEQEKRAKEAEADDLPRIAMTVGNDEIEYGTIVVELFENEAPNTVANFVSLVEDDFYDGLSFHRVIPAFMAQGGCPEGTGAGGPGYSIDCECYQDDIRRHFRGTLSMANAGPNTNGSQFFLTFIPTAHLNGRHTVFGRVIEGMDLLSRLQRIDPEAKAPIEPDLILDAEVLRKRDHEYEPVKNNVR